MSKIFIDYPSLTNPPDPSIKAGDDISLIWCRNLMAMLADGGVWGIPRSGLTFTKNGEHSLNLSDVATGYNPAMQRGDFDATRAHFAAAGITVTDTENKLNKTKVNKKESEITK